MKHVIQQKQRLVLLTSAATILIALVILHLTPRIPQDVHYHAFANDAERFGIPHFWNVITNLAFLIIGSYALWHLPTHYKIERKLFKGCIAIGLGSAIYHLQPNTLTLFADRLPMAIVFVLLLIVVIKDFVSIRLANRLLWPGLFISGLSVVYWLITELIGKGDLRPYALVQFLPLIIIPYFLWINRYELKRKFVLLALGTYLIAKLLEHFDHQLFDWIHYAGHPLKHIAAALALLFFYQHIKFRINNNT